jgi:hypothetical protein
MPTIQARNVNHPDHQENLKEEKYTLVSEAIMASLPGSSSATGMPFPELEEQVRAYLVETGAPMALFPKPGSVRWYTKAVQLDLEARELIERVPDQTPLRLRRVAH